MPKNTKGGKSHKRGKKAGTAQVSTAITYKDTNEKQEYAKVISLSGECRMMVQVVGAAQESPFFNKTEPVLCKIPGSFRKRVFINKGDYILISMREFQEGKVDALCKYTGVEAKALMKAGEIPFDDISAGTNGEEVDWITEEAAAEPSHQLKNEEWFNSLLPTVKDDSDDDNTPSVAVPLNNRQSSLQQQEQEMQLQLQQQKQKQQQNKNKKNVSFVAAAAAADDDVDDKQPDIDLATL
jgi:translation initiation factor 1A